LIFVSHAADSYKFRYQLKTFSLPKLWPKSGNLSRTPEAYVTDSNESEIIEGYKVAD